MKNMLPMPRRWPCLPLLLTILASPAGAHDFYILPDSFNAAPKSHIRVAFHNGDSFPASESAPVLARLKDAELRSQGGTVTIEGIRVDGKRVVGTVETPSRGGNLILSAHTAPNFISLEPGKFLDYLKEEGLAEVIRWRSDHGEDKKASRERYSKFAKAILVSGAPDDFYKQALGFPIEIVPEANPYTLHAGSRLPVRVVFRGKPAPGLQLEAAWADGGKSKTRVIGRTDSEGRISVPLAAPGKWRLHSLLMERCAEPAAADWESFWASLTFEIR